VNKIVYIVSVKYAAGSKKEFILFGDNLRKKGLNVRYLLAKPYKKLEANREETDYITVSDGLKTVMLDTLKLINGRKFIQIFSAFPPAFVCFYNAHPLNPVIARLLKKRFPKAIVCLYLHDPYKPDKKSYGIGKAAYITLVELIQKLTVRYMDHVVSPSLYSSQIFRKYYPKFKGAAHIGPLLVPDQKISEDKKRRFFSIVGVAHNATGHDTFVQLVNYVAERGLGYEFAIISARDISSHLANLTEKASRIVTVINEKIISDSQINKVVRESYAVFRLDREVTQSGVIPVSYMNGTPVIVRDIPGLTQHVKHAKNGYVIETDCLPADIVRAMDFVKQNFIELSKNARKSYEEIWSECNFEKYYNWLIELLRAKTETIKSKKSCSDNICKQIGR